MYKLAFLIFIIGFFLFRPYQMERSGMMYSGDDESYFAHATSIAYGQFPSYKKEFFSTGGANPLHPIGPGLMAAPFVYAFSWGDRLEGNEIVQVRKADNIEQSWSVYGFSVAAVFYLWLGCLFLYVGLRQYFNEFETVLGIFLMVLCQGIPLFVFRRPVFSHIFEFCVVSILVWLLILPRDKWKVWSQYWLSAFGLGALLGILILIRQNNIMILMLWPLILFILQVDPKDRHAAWRNILIAYVLAGAVYVGLQMLPDIFYHNNGQNDVIKNLLLKVQSPLFYLQRIWHVLTGPDWGLIYSAPFILVGLGAAIIQKHSLRRVVLISLLPLCVNFYVVMAWMTQGGWYGYRYLIATAAALLAFPFTLFLNRMEKRFGKAVVLIAALLISLPPLFSMLMFEGDPGNLTLHVIQQYFGVTGWGNNMYQWNVWMMLRQHPVGSTVIICKGGGLYLLTCWRMLVNSPALIDTIIRGIYLNFSLTLFAKTTFIYLFPFMLTFIAHLFNNEVSRLRALARRRDKTSG